MVSYIEKMLGMKNSSYTIPGQKTESDGTIIYLEDQTKSFQIFDSFTDSLKERKASSGGIMDRACQITLPRGEILHAIYYHGDLAGWRQDIEFSAKELNLLTGVIEKDKIVLSNGERYPLADCKIEDSLAPKDSEYAPKESHGGAQDNELEYPEEQAIEDGKLVLKQFHVFEEAAAIVTGNANAILLAALEEYKSILETKPELWENLSQIIYKRFEAYKLKPTKEVEDFIELCEYEIFPIMINDQTWLKEG